MQDKTPVEINPATTLDPSLEERGLSASPTVAVKKTFVEPQVSLPTDVLEATAFFQGSAALDVADS